MEDSCPLCSVNGTVPTTATRLKYLGDDAPPDIVPYISPHWRKFPAPPDSLHYALGTTYIVLMILSTSFNGLLIFLTLTKKTLRTWANMLVLSLACSDFLMMSKMSIFIYNSFHKGPYLGALGCQVYGGISVLSGFSAIWAITAIAYQRYVVVAYPFQMSKRLSRKQICAIIVIIWVISAVFTVAPYFGWGRYAPEGYLTSCTFDFVSTDWNTRSFVLVSAMVAWLFPMLTICGCYGGIIRQTKNNARMMKSILTREDSSAMSASTFSTKRVNFKCTQTQTERGLVPQRTTEETVEISEMPVSHIEVADDDDDVNDDEDDPTNSGGPRRKPERVRLRPLNRFPRILSVTSDTSDTDTAGLDAVSPMEQGLQTEAVISNVSRDSYTSRNMKTEIKLNKLVALVVILWFISWTPYAFVAALGAASSQILTPGVAMLPALFCKASAIINPVMYGLRHPKYKRELKILFGIGSAARIDRN